jgi:hypothetical protein
LDLIHLDPFICVSFSGIFQFLQKITLSAAILGVIGYMEGCGLQHGRLWIAAWKVVDCSMEGCGLLLTGTSTSAVLVSLEFIRFYSAHPEWDPLGSFV